MVKKYEFAVKGLATYYRCFGSGGGYFSSHWERTSQRDAIINENQQFYVGKINLSYVPTKYLDPEKYNYYLELTPVKLMADKIIGMMKELGFNQASKLQQFNCSDEHNANNFGGGAWDSTLAFSHPLFGSDTYLCFTFSSSDRAYQWNCDSDYNLQSLRSWQPDNENVQALHLVRNNVTQGNIGITRTIPSAFELSNTYTIIKNEKTNEFLITQGSVSSTRLSVLFAFFLDSKGKQVFYMPINDNNPVFTRNEEGEFVNSYSIGTGAGFFNSNIITEDLLNQKTIIVPSYFTIYGTNNITLENQCPSLKKAKGLFKVHQEYVIDNELYYCIYVNGTNAILFNEGVAVSK